MFVTQYGPPGVTSNGFTESNTLLANGQCAITIMSCDNIQGNDDVARMMFCAYATRKDADLGAWMADNICFPNSMVDSITPVTTDDDKAEVRSRLAIDGAWPVVCEPFTQWVLEDRFNQNRPTYEDVGMQIVNDVEPYELMKLRLLNASH